MLESSPKASGSKQDILDAFEQGKAQSAQLLRSFSEAEVNSQFKLISGGKTVASMPVMVVIREILLNHMDHHRGQLTTYLRAVGARVPAVFGDSADENPFAQAGA